MNYEDILDELSKSLTLKSKYNFTQKDLDNILEICIKNNWKERAWRLALTLGSLKKYNFINFVKYYISERDSYYLSELIHFVFDLNLKQVFAFIQETDDEKFIGEMINELMSYFVVNTKEDLIKELEKY